jgi:phosphate:Na+ symporter
VGTASATLEWQPGVVVLAGFHSGFTLLCALLVLPGVARFGALIERAIPERFPSLTRRLDASVAELPEVAMEAVRRTLIDILVDIVSVTRRALRGETYSVPERASEWKNALKETRRFLGSVPALSSRSEQLGTRISIIHAWDHLMQLADVVENPLRRPLPHAAARLREPQTQLIDLLDEAQSLLVGESPRAAVDALKRRSQQLAEFRRNQRRTLLLETAQVIVDPGVASRILKGLRWLDAIGYHTWRAMHHLMETEAEALPASAPFIDEADPY